MLLNRFDSISFTSRFNLYLVIEARHVFLICFNIIIFELILNKMLCYKTLDENNKKNPKHNQFI